MPNRAVNWQDRIGRRLKLRDLHILSMVVEWGSMAKAAAHLGISQPSVSEAIADLEQTIGLKLLDRSRQGVTPTVYGSALLMRSRAAFDELQQGIRDVEFLADPTSGRLSIACPETLTAGFVPTVIDQLQRKYPGLVIDVVQTNPVAVEFRDLRERSVDLVLARALHSVAADDLHVETLFDDRLFVVAGAKHRLARRRKIKLSDLAHEQWIGIPPESIAGSFAARAFQTNGMENPMVLTFSQHLRYHLLATGRYLATMPGSVLHYNAATMSLKALPIDLRLPSRPVVVVTLKNRTITPVATLFIECARMVARSFDKRSGGPRV